MVPKTILLIDDDDVLRRVLTHHLEEAGYAVRAVSGGAEAVAMFQSTNVDAIVTDLAMPDMDGYNVIMQLRAMSPDVPIIVITAYGSIDSAVQAMKAGADDYITKPFGKEHLLLNVQRTLARSSLLRENRALRRFISEYFSLENIVGTSKPMRAVYQMVERVAPTTVTVLLLGESGTGKELLAKAIHQNSPRSAQPFVAINCAAIPEGLLESEFFGHRKGAFTGAHADAKGKLEIANGGTLFLDEVGDLPLGMQAKLLRVLQDGEFTRVGDTASRRADVRFIAATNRDLPKMIEARTFREELYFRLNIVPIWLPPLRERREDLVLLMDFFLKGAAKRYDRPALTFSKEVFTLFQSYAWPGNIRELRNAIERMVVLARSDALTLEDVPEEIRSNRKSGSTLPFILPEGGIDLEQVEREIVRQALERNGWNQTAASRFLNVTRSVLITRMQRYGLFNPERKQDSSLDSV